MNHIEFVDENGTTFIIKKEAVYGVVIPSKFLSNHQRNQQQAVVILMGGNTVVSPNIARAIAKEIFLDVISEAELTGGDENARKH